MMVLPCSTSELPKTKKTQEGFKIYFPLGTVFLSFVFFRTGDMDLKNAPAIGRQV